MEPREDAHESREREHLEGEAGNQDARSHLFLLAHPVVRAGHSGPGRLDQEREHVADHKDTRDQVCLYAEEPVVGRG